MAGQVGWRARSGGGLVGGEPVGRRAGWEGGPGGQRGVYLQSKECSGVSIVT